MFPMCHIYFAEKVIGVLSDYTVLGCIYPDMYFSNTLNRDTTHYNTQSLYEYFKSEDEQVKQFCIGAITHGVDMRGLDYYSDEKFKNFDKGYCFEKGKEIEKRVIECCNIPEKWGLWKAHNFIEMAFEHYLCKRNKWVIDAFNRALENDLVLSHVSNHMQNFYNIPAQTLKQSFKNFKELVHYNGINEYSIMERYAIQLNRKHGIKLVDVPCGALLIHDTQEMISEDINSFFEFTISEVKEVINTVSK